ncbi:hypothetical protein ABKN59_002214 [Abortiporus biennis]
MALNLESRREHTSAIVFLHFSDSKDLMKHPTFLSPNRNISAPSRHSRRTTSELIVDFSQTAQGLEYNVSI